MVKLKYLWIVTSVVTLLMTAEVILAEESASASFRSPVQVFSSGGGSLNSSNYSTQSTMGQSSPLMDPGDPPFSSSYDLYPGFWYAITAGGCPGDYYGDGDVDGLDLYYFILDYPGGIPLETFADYFGRNDCFMSP